MTRLKKLLVAGLMVIVTCCVSLGSALLNLTQSIFSWVKASDSNGYDYSNGAVNTTTDGNIITVSKIPTKVKRGEDIEIPAKVFVTNVGESIATVDPVTPTKVDIRTPYGVSLLNNNNEPKDDSLVILSDNKYTIKEAKDIGVYTVQYAYQNTDSKIWTLSDIYEIEVTADSYDIEFSKNNTIVMPDKIDTNQEVDSTVSISLPMLYDGEGKLIESFVLGDESNEYAYVAAYKKFENVWIDENNCPVEVVGNNNGDNNIYEEFYAYEITKVSTSSELPKFALIIEVKVPGQSSVTNSKITVEDKDRLKLNVAQNSFENGAEIYDNLAYQFKANSGKNIITYKVCEYTDYLTTAPVAYVNYTIDGSTAYDSSKIDLGVSIPTVLKSKDTTVREKVYLPEVSAVNKLDNKTSVNAYYSYKVEYINESDDYDVSSKYVTMGVDAKGTYFIAHEEGHYMISYNAVDFYGNIDKNADSYKFELEVLDNTEPSVKYVKSYDYKSKNIDLEDYSYIIPTKYYLDETAQAVEIAIPAIYTKDNYIGFDDLTISRTLKSEKGFINSDKNSVKNFSMSIQNSLGTTDTNAYSSSNSIDVKNIISFKDFVAEEFIVCNNGFYSKEGFSVSYTNVELLDGEGNGTGKADESTYTTLDIANIDSTEDLAVLEGNKFIKVNGTALSGDALIKAKTSQVAYIKLDKNLFGEGSYTVQYSIQDGRFENHTGNSFTFTLVKGKAVDVDAKAPTVKFADSTIGNVTQKQTITIDKPEIKDEVDTNLLIKYYIVVDGNFHEIFLDENKKLTFNTSDVVIKAVDSEDEDKTIYDLAVASDSKSFDVVAIAYDDMSAYTDIRSIADLKNPGANIGVGIYNISVKYVTDTLAPVILSKVNTAGVNENEDNKQYKDITVHGIKYYDDTNSAQINIRVLDSNGISCDYKEVDGYYSKLVENPEGFDGYVYEYNFPGITFTANKADSYTVIYSITDGGNNVTTYAFVVKETIDAQPPVISGLVGTTKTIQLGETFYLKNLTVTDTKSEMTADKVTFTVVGNKVGNCTRYLNNMEFTPKAVDTYTITVTAKDDHNNKTTKSFVIEVKDTIKPTLTISDANSGIITIEEGEDKENPSVNWDESKFPVIDLPGFSVKDAYQGTAGFSGIIGATGTIILTTPDGEAYTIDINGEISGENPLEFTRVQSGTSSYNFTFKPSKRGHYTATYVAEDKAGNKSDAQVIDIYVGDTERPIIYLSKSLLNKLNKGFVIGDNDELVIDPEAKEYVDTIPSTDLYLKDNFGFTLNTNKAVKVAISVSDKNGNTVSKIDNDDNFVYYQFDKEGTYTITFTVTDSVGNTGTLTKSFKVTAKSTSTFDAGQILGTVLIVVSVAILAGVVIYFIKGTKLLPKKGKKAKKQSSDKKED